MSFFEELKRRNVIKVGIAYTVVGWLVAQVAEFATENFGAPEWVLKIFVVFLILGLPVVSIFAWAFEMTPEGIKREKDVDRSQSITHLTGQKLNYTIIALLTIALAYFIWESRFAAGPEESRNVSAEMSDTPQFTGPGVEVRKESSDNSIAVLPFANRSRLEDDEFFTDGIHDDLLTQLAKIHDLKVISRTSMLKYKDSQLSIPEIASELGVSTILEGGVQRAGKRIRINAQLIDVTTDEHLWAETFDREMTMENIFDIQSEITRQIVNAVRGELTEEESKALNELPTTNVAAYEAYLKARALAYDANWTLENFIRALPWAEIAVKLDPQFARAWSMLALVHGQLIWIGYESGEERIAAMRKATDMAQQLAPDEPWSWLAEGEYQYRIERNYQASLAAMRKAHEAMPGNAEFLERIALSQRRLGLWEESVNSCLQVMLLDPGNVSAARLAVETLANMKQWDRVLALGAEWSANFSSSDIASEVAFAHIGRSGDLETARKLLDKIPPVAGETYVSYATLLPLLERDYQAAIDIWELPEVVAMAAVDGWRGSRELQRGFAYAQMGSTTKATEQFRKGLQIFNGLSPESPSSNLPFDFMIKAFAHAMLGENELALDASRTARALMPESLDVMDGTIIASRRAQILGMTGHRDEALVEIERLLEKPWGLSRWFMYLDPQWDFFRDDERFNELIRPHNLDEVTR